MFSYGKKKKKRKKERRKKERKEKARNAVLNFHFSLNQHAYLQTEDCPLTVFFYFNKNV